MDNTTNDTMGNITNDITYSECPALNTFILAMCLTLIVSFMVDVATLRRIDRYNKMIEYHHFQVLIIEYIVIFGVAVWGMVIYFGVSDDCLVMFETEYVLLWNYMLALIIYFIIMYSIGVAIIIGGFIVKNVLITKEETTCMNLSEHLTESKQSTSTSTSITTEV